jgi:hypothetical protein
MLNYPYPIKDKCLAMVYKKDTYRVSRGRGFKMHYTRCQCSRKPIVGSEYCAQHAKMVY